MILAIFLFASSLLTPNMMPRPPAALEDAATLLRRGSRRSRQSRRSPAAPNYTISVVLIFILNIVIRFKIAILLITAATAGEDSPSPPSRCRIRRATISVGRSRSSVAPLPPQTQQSHCRSDRTAAHRPPLPSRRKPPGIPERPQRPTPTTHETCLAPPSSYHAAVARCSPSAVVMGARAWPAAARAPAPSSSPASPAPRWSP